MNLSDEAKEAIFTFKNLKTGVTALQIAKAMKVVESGKTRLPDYFKRYIGRTLKKYEELANDDTKFEEALKEYEKKNDRMEETESKRVKLGNEFEIPSPTDTPKASSLYSQFQMAQTWHSIHSLLQNGKESGLKPEDFEKIPRQLRRMMMDMDEEDKEQVRKQESKEENIGNSQENKAKDKVLAKFKKVVELTLFCINGYDVIAKECEGIDRPLLEILWQHVTIYTVVLLFNGVNPQELVNGIQSIANGFQGMQVGPMNFLQLFGQPQHSLTNTANSNFEPSNSTDRS